MKCSLKNIFSFTLTLILLSSCKSELNVKVSDADQIGFNGIDSVTSVTDSTANIKWTSSQKVKSYQVFSISANGSRNYIDTIDSPATNFTVTGLTPSTEITLGVRAIDENLNVDTNTNYKTIQTNLAPNTPSAITISSPTTSSNVDATPTFTISGVKSGDTIKLFTDSNCSTKVGEAVSTGETISITSSALTDGSYNLYSTASATNESTCSTATTSYTKTVCPSGYIEVPAMASVGVTNNFCVMQYEAKNNFGNASAYPETKPWVAITLPMAKDECTYLNTLNGVTNKYDLISNPEWMAIARNIENVAENWTTGTVGDGCLKRGNVGSALPCPGSGSGGDSGYNGDSADFGTSRNSLASLALSNENTIWDFSGNLLEWVDWTLGGALANDLAQANKPQDTGNTNWTELTDIDNLPTATTTAASVLPSNLTFNSAHGTGTIYPGTTSGAPLRGGNSGHAANAGIYSLILSEGAITYNNIIGFRCVYRP